MKRGRLLGHIQKRVRMVKVRRFLLWGGFALAAWALVGGDHGFVRYRLLKHRQVELELDKQKLEIKAMDLEREIWRLKNDTLYIEKMARERLGYARPDERVFKITQH